MKSRLLLAVLCLYATAAGACINTYDARLAGHLSTLKYERANMGPTIQKLERAHAANATPEAANDLAVAYIFAGAYDKAIALLRQLEKTHPGLAKTAANLGTAFELSGKDAEALHWIKQGIRRDRDEHDGTEWLHVRILEAKRAVARDPDWLSTHSVLGIDFGTRYGGLPRTPPSLPKDARHKPLTLPEIERALGYQLTERIKFVVPPDPYMADLFVDRGHIATLLKAPGAAEYYKAAQLFGPLKDKVRP